MRSALGTITTRSFLTPTPLYNVLLPVPGSATHHTPLEERASPPRIDEIAVYVRGYASRVSHDVGLLLLSCCERLHS